RIEQGAVDAQRRDAPRERAGHGRARADAHEEIEVGGAKVGDRVLDGGEHAHLVHRAGEPAPAEAEADDALIVVQLVHGLEALSGGDRKNTAARASAVAEAATTVGGRWYTSSPRTFSPSMRRSRGWRSASALCAAWMTIAGVMERAASEMLPR